MEALEEKQVTSGGKRYPLDAPFFVLATQNPIEQEGTYPLPVAQLDRFMFEIKVDYPSFEEEYAIVALTTSGYKAALEPLISRDEILELLGIVRRVEVPDDVMRYATALARATRGGKTSDHAWVREWIAWGAGPRAAHYLLLGGKARALLRGRHRVKPGDIRAIAHPTLRHRIITTYHAEAEGVTADRVVDELLRSIASPDGWTPPRERGGLAAQQGRTTA
jgi:MoxR-like ATPase